MAEAVPWHGLAGARPATQGPAETGWALAGMMERRPRRLMGALFQPAPSPPPLPAAAPDPDDVLCSLLLL
jgi:hypothetical protein